MKNFGKSERVIQVISIEHDVERVAKSSGNPYVCSLLKYLDGEHMKEKIFLNNYLAKATELKATLTSIKAGDCLKVIVETSEKGTDFKKVEKTDLPFGTPMKKFEDGAQAAAVGASTKTVSNFTSSNALGMQVGNAMHAVSRLASARIHQGGLETREALKDFIVETMADLLEVSDKFQNTKPAIAAKADVPKTKAYVPGKVINDEVVDFDS